MATIGPNRGGNELAVALQTAAGLLQSGRGDMAAQAVAVMSTAVKRWPTSPDAHNLLARSLLATGKAEGAAKAVKKALSLAPKQAGIHLTKAQILEAMGKVRPAIQAAQKAVALDPKQVSSYSVLSSLFRKDEQFAEAVEALETAIALAPNMANLHHQQGLAYRELQQLDKAEDCFHQALKNQPSFAPSLFALGLLCREKENFDEALVFLQKATTTAPQNAHYQLNLGTLYSDLLRFEEALAAFDRTIALQPNMAVAHGLRGSALIALNKPAEGEAAFRKAIEILPDYAEAHFNLALHLMRQGRMEEGVKEHEWRLKMPGFVPPGRDNRPPMWDGSSLEGKTILLQSEFGLGDTIQLARYAPLVKAMGAKVIFEVVPKGKALLESLEGVDEFTIRGQEPLPTADVRCPVMSLMAVMGTTLDTIPANVPYLSADPAYQEKWHKELAGEKRFKVGLAWQGNPQYGGDNERSIEFSELRSLLEIPGVCFYGLQKGLGEEQIEAFPDQALLKDRFVNLSPLFPDAMGILAELDLAICCDSSLAHLAGAMGRPLWIPMYKDVEWRWHQIERTDSPWYPTARLYRKMIAGDWSEIMEKMSADLKAELSSKRPPP